MEIQTKQYQHFKGGLYQVYGEIQPLDAGFYNADYSFIAKDAATTNEVEIISVNGQLFYAPFDDVPMVLYKSEQTNEWWLREAGEFHGFKVHDDGEKVERFTILDENIQLTQI